MTGQHHPDWAGASDLLRVSDLQMHFPRAGSLFRAGGGVVRAVDGVSFAVRAGETVGLVGESGSGKTTTGRAILQLYRPTAGTVVFDGTELTSTDSGTLRRMRRKMQMIFQDPQSSLDPRMTIAQILSQPLDIHGLARGRKRVARIGELLETVGLDPAFASRYPHQFSGGQRQRIGIARALAVEPTFIVCDEPVSALDVSIQAQIINLLRDLQARFALTYLFVAHDLALVRHISDRIAVMYLGKLMEIGPSEQVYGMPSHPYTRALLSAVPVPKPAVERKRRRIILTGDIPSPAHPPSGCRFHTRCWHREALGNPARCAEEEPALREVTSGWFSACHYAELLPATSATAGMAEVARPATA
jgi:oligopeptide transport system ATP-binding protein